MANDFAAAKEWIAKVGDAVNGEALGRILDKAGAAGKKSALEAAAADLGPDRRFRNFKGKPPLNAGYDPAGPTSVQINFRPKGLWNLAEEGRQSDGLIYRRSSGGKLTARGTIKTTKGSAKKFGKAVGSFSGGQHAGAVRTPDGPRAHSGYKHSRGKGTFTDAVSRAQRSVPDAAADQIDDELRRIL